MFTKRVGTPASTKRLLQTTTKSRLGVAAGKVRIPHNTTTFLRTDLVEERYTTCNESPSAERTSTARGRSAKARTTADCDAAF